MDLGVSTRMFSSEGVRPALLERLRSGGFERIELYANRPHLDYHDRGVQKELARWFQSNPVKAPSLHLPFFEATGRTVEWLSALSSEERRRQKTLDEIKRALEFTDRLTISYAVVHLGAPREPFNPIQFEYAYTLIDTISGFAGVDILIENTANEISTVDRIRDFLTAARLSSIGICYDSGHGRFQGPLPEFGSIRALHLNDSRPEAEDHLLPFQGDVDWPAIAEEIVVSGYDGPAVFEAATEDIAGCRDAADRLRDLAAEARSGLEEFRVKYKRVRRQDEDDLH